MTPSSEPSLQPILVPMYFCYRDVFHSVLRAAEISWLETLWKLPIESNPPEVP
jgi:hypothetical protein